MSGFPRHPAAVVALAALASLALACSGQGGAAQNQAVVLEVHPPVADVLPSGSVSFSASVTGTAAPSVQWSVTEANGGTIDASGHYVAPATLGTYHVVAQSVADPTVRGEAVVQVTNTPAVAVDLFPRTATVAVGRILAFSAVVTGNSDGTVIWSVQEPSGCGQVSQDGLYTAPAAPATCHVAAASRADPSQAAVATVTVTAASAGGPSKYLVGLNTALPSDWDRSSHYADVFKVSNGFGSAPVDSLGWPASDFTVEVFGGYIYMNGAYALSFTGQASDVAVGSGGGSIAGLRYDAASNTSTATVTISDAGANLILIFSGTRRTASSPAGSGVTDIRLMRPVTPGSSQSYPASTLFHTPLKAMLSKVQIVRYMDFTATNWSRTSVWGGYPWQPSTAYSVGQRVSVHPVWVYECTVAGTSAAGAAAAPIGTGSDIADGTVHWKFVGYGRTTPGQASYNRWSNTNGFGWQGVGDPLEHLVRFANETQTDVWVNVPLLADDDYIRKMAQLFRYGSDGVMPYTSPQASPAFPPLDAGLKIYLEYSNELWNGAFAQCNENRDLAVAEVASYPGGTGPLNYDGETDPWTFAARRVAKRALEASLIFREVFGDGQMMTRVRPALMTQQGGGFLHQPTQMLLGYYANFDGNHVSQPHPPGYYFYGVGGTTYWNTDTDSGVTLDSMWNLGQFNVSTFSDLLVPDIAHAAGMGLHRIVYEGGPDLPNAAFSGGLGVQAVADPRMGTSIVDHWRAWRAYGGEEFVFYQAIGDYRWGFADNPYDTATVKMNALESIIASDPAPVTYGTTIPGAVDGNAYAFERGWSHGSGGGAASFGAGFPFASYSFRATSTASRTVVLTVSSASGTVAVYLDGVKIGEQAATNGNMPFPAGTVSADGTGIHGVMVRASSGSFTVSQVAVQ